MKIYIKYLSIIIVILGIVYILGEIAFLNTKIVCAKVKYEGYTRSRKGIVYFYKYNGEVYKGTFDSSAGICLDIECYQDEECLDVEVSTLLPFMSRVKVSKPR